MIKEVNEYIWIFLFDRILSDRELRTLIAKIYKLPIDVKVLNEFENKLVNCSNDFSQILSKNQKKEIYYLKSMVIISILQYFIPYNVLYNISLSSFFSHK